MSCPSHLGMLRTRYILARGCSKLHWVIPKTQSRFYFWKWILTILKWKSIILEFWVNFWLRLSGNGSSSFCATEWLHDQIKVTFSYLKFRIFQSGRKYQSNNKAAELTLEHPPACPPYLQHCSWHRLALLCCCITASSASSHVLLTVACLYWSG